MQRSKKISTNLTSEEFDQFVNLANLLKQKPSEFIRACLDFYLAHLNEDAVLLSIPPNTVPVSICLSHADYASLTGLAKSEQIPPTIYVEQIIRRFIVKNVSQLDLGV